MRRQRMTERFDHGTLMTNKMKSGAAGIARDNMQTLITFMVDARQTALAARATHAGTRTSTLTAPTGSV
jgi:hypothetical protein